MPISWENWVGACLQGVHVFLHGRRFYSSRGYLLPTEFWMSTVRQQSVCKHWPKKYKVLLRFGLECTWMYIHEYVLLLFKNCNFYEIFLSTRIVHAHYSSLENNEWARIKKIKITPTPSSKDNHYDTPVLASTPSYFPMAAYSFYKMRLYQSNYNYNN